MNVIAVRSITIATAALVLPLMILAATDDKLAEPQDDVILITVVDAADDKPIGKFRVLAGVTPGFMRPAMQPDGVVLKVANWQPQTLRDGTDGSCRWPLSHAYDVMALRVEADGFEPASVMWVKKSDGPQRIRFELKQDPGIPGRVLTPDGKSAAGAMIAIGLPHRTITVERGEIRGVDEPLPADRRDRWRRPVIVTADAFGRFRLSTEIDPAAALLVVHESGVGEFMNDDFKEDRQITLSAWGRIEGAVLWKDKPGEGERVTLSVMREDYGSAGIISGHAETLTDADGRFVFEKVLPGVVQVSHSFRVSDKTSENPKVGFAGLFHLHVNVAAGVPTAVQIGGQGRMVTGRFRGRDSWQGVTFHFHPNAPHIGLQGDDVQWKAFASIQQSPIGPLFFRDGLEPNADGKFEIPHVLPGQYQLFISASDTKGSYAGAAQFDVPDEKPGEAAAPLDLGVIALTKTKKELGHAQQPSETKSGEGQATAR